LEEYIQGLDDLEEQKRRISQIKKDIDKLNIYIYLKH